MYEFAVGSTLEDLKAREGIVGAAFGDLYLNDVRDYRRGLLARYGLRAEFPLWGMRTDLLARRILRAGAEVYLASVDPAKLDRSFVGARWTESLVRSFPPTVDPCGENGEFHTVITDGPMFAASVRIQRGDDFEDGAMVVADFEVAPEAGR
jgi:diphthamide synthase (EF-2-diphthine--ammonia ligase)